MPAPLPSSAASASAPGQLEYPLGDDIALDEGGAPGDRRAARLVRQPQPAGVVVGTVVGTVVSSVIGSVVIWGELAAEGGEREPEVGQVLHQRAEEELADRANRDQKTHASGNT